MAGQFAKAVNARTLIITHFSPKSTLQPNSLVADPSSLGSFGTHKFNVDQLVSQAAEAFEKDSVIPAYDSMVFSVPLLGSTSRNKVEPSGDVQTGQ